MFKVTLAVITAHGMDYNFFNSSFPRVAVHGKRKFKVPNSWEIIMTPPNTTMLYEYISTLITKKKSSQIRSDPRNIFKDPSILMMSICASKGSCENIVIDKVDRIRSTHPDQLYTAPSITLFYENGLYERVALGTIFRNGRYILLSDIVNHINTKIYVTRNFKLIVTTCTSGEYESATTVAP